MVSLFLEVLRGMIATMPLYVLHTLERGSAAVDFVSLCFELLESEDEGDAAIAAEVEVAVHCGRLSFITCCGIVVDALVATGGAGVAISILVSQGSW